MGHGPGNFKMQIQYVLLVIKNEKNIYLVKNFIFHLQFVSTGFAFVKIVKV